ncbi:hypothetical protein ABL78_5055 [Leptomonas seymouri]|uniref:C3H1-type domain-containing protein n=1 Tax=Leptomonas seymouri TaxID=5684 RepID=A0A0N1HXE0_LEPSE|nr:hypothetical protein ABL78_5055 [Leptomonas seymouri]|eukprot:KPI85874.1 hypothetical protein ABL78_5055 [Leptomonas seymouri]
MPVFGDGNVPAWTSTENRYFGRGSASNRPTPNEADVKALLQLLSCDVDDEELLSNETAMSHERRGAQSQPDNSEASEERVACTNGYLKAGGNRFHHFGEQDPEDASVKLLRPEPLTKGGAICRTLSCPYRNSDSSTDTLTGSSNGSSRTDQRLSTATSRSTELSIHFSPSLSSQHNKTAPNALGDVGSGLAAENFNVLTPNKRIMLSIPAEYIQPTAGSRNYRGRSLDKFLFFCLCKAYCSGATCHYGADCDFIHCDPEKLLHARDAAELKGKKADPAAVHSFQVHWSTPVNSLAEAAYPRLPSGYVVYVKGGDGAGSRTPLALPSETVYATVGGQGALRLSSTAPLRICKHYEREKCACGALCHFIHPVVLSKSARPACSDGPADVGALPCCAEANPCNTEASTPSAFGPLSEPDQSVVYAPRAPPPATVGCPSAPLVAAAPWPSRALDGYRDALFMWVPEQQQLVPVHTTAVSPFASPVAGPPPTVMVGVDYRRGPGGTVGSLAGLQVPAGAILMQPSNAVAACPPHNPYNNSSMQRCQANLSAPNGASPVYPSMLFFS